MTLAPKNLDAIYDIEVYPNVFLCTLYHYSFGSTGMATYEISERRNDIKPLTHLLSEMMNLNSVMVGFNNMGYDWPILNSLYEYVSLNPEACSWRELTSGAYEFSKFIIESTPEEKFKSGYIIYNPSIKQIDLLKIHHFDNKARGTSLKQIEFCMRSENLQDLPFSPHEELSESEINQLILYNQHDVRETYKFYKRSSDKINFREILSKKYQKDFTNHNDTKIGKSYFITKLEERLGPYACYEKSKAKQTPRKYIRLGDIILDSIEFEQPAFKAILDWLKIRALESTKNELSNIHPNELESIAQHSSFKMVKGFVKDLNVVINGFKYVFGTGGLHGCVDPTYIESDGDYEIYDLDVTSFYPSIAIHNEFYPEHLTMAFCEIYKEVMTERLKYRKGTPENAMLKLALNGVFGDSNSPFSPFFDPQFTMSITINGQLLLCMLCEKLISVKGLEMIQANTDGITVKVPRMYLDRFWKLCNEWENYTGLHLEQTIYSKLFIRDVNNYIGKLEDGTIKRKGAFECRLDWHQNWSSLVVQKAAESYLLNGTDYKTFITSHKDLFDFMLFVKVNRKSKLILRTPEKDVGVQGKTRYYVSRSNDELIKLLPPLNDKVEDREIRVNAGWNHTVCNNIDHFNWNDLNYDFYIQEVEKLIKPFGKEDLEQTNLF